MAHDTSFTNQNFKVKVKDDNEEKKIIHRLSLMQSFQQKKKSFIGRHSQSAETDSQSVTVSSQSSVSQY